MVLLLQPDTISIPRKSLKFHDDELQKECEEKPQENHFFETFPENTDNQQYFLNDNDEVSGNEIF